MIRLRKAAVWVFVVILAAVFLRAGLSKLAGGEAVRWAERFAQWGYPGNAHSAVGLLEILGALGLLIQRCRRAAAALLAILMAGALCTHAVHGELPRLPPPLVLGGLAFALLGRIREPGAR
jgi:putative oxidoreductase